MAIKTEHSGAKNGGGYWGRRVVAKEVSNHLRRQDDKLEAKTIPCTDCSGPDIRQLQEDGSSKVIGYIVVRGGAGGYTEENVLY